VGYNTKFPISANSLLLDSSPSIFTENTFHFDVQRFDAHNLSIQFRLGHYILGQLVEGFLCHTVCRVLVY